VNADCACLAADTSLATGLSENNKPWWFFFYSIYCTGANHNTGGPRYMQEIGTPKIDSHITNLHIKRPRMNVN